MAKGYNPYRNPLNGQFTTASGAVGKALDLVSGPGSSRSARGRGPSSNASRRLAAGADSRTSTGKTVRRGSVRSAQRDTSMPAASWSDDPGGTRRVGNRVERVTQARSQTDGLSRRDGSRVSRVRDLTDGGPRQSKPKREPTFRESLSSMSDVELADRAKSYWGKKDSISIQNSNAVREEVQRRKQARSGSKPWTERSAADLAAEDAAIAAERKARAERRAAARAADLPAAKPVRSPEYEAKVAASRKVPRPAGTVWNGSAWVKPNEMSAPVVDANQLPLRRDFPDDQSWMKARDDVIRAAGERMAKSQKDLMTSPGSMNPRVTPDNVGEVVRAQRAELERARNMSADKKYAPGSRRIAKQHVADHTRILKSIEKEYPGSAPEFAAKSKPRKPASEPRATDNAQTRVGRRQAEIAASKGMTVAEYKKQLTQLSRQQTAEIKKQVGYNPTKRRPAAGGRPLSEPKKKAAPKKSAPQSGNDFLPPGLSFGTGKEGAEWNPQRRSSGGESFK